MSRPRPQISPQQKQNLANFSRAQSHDEAARRKLEAMGQELNRSFAEARETLDKNADVLAKHYAWSNRYGHWLARVALLPIVVLAIGMVVVVILGLWNGEIKELQKYSKLHVTRTGNPIAYWASVICHSALASFITWITVVVFRAARLGRKNAT
ncbi:hypothetical protein [Rhodoferax saidenbachensis]|uniref:Uncharacterized protein n=1 Tax=Rhodoferax saidenbachensis TaxID=1484693 RepID=A0ABU1ZJF1_9BURK|nr:hypothetical protein [Rhodoferax saidenbachensis]MDR7305682.1 hypothetical protein [Rhodoferax saidenbachensis]